MSAGNPQSKVCDEATRVLIETRRALGWSQAKTANSVSLPVAVVQDVWAQQDQLVGVDSFDLVQPKQPRGPRRVCRRGLHALTPENVTVKPNGDRYCRACKNASQRAAWASKHPKQTA